MILKGIKLLLIAVAVLLAMFAAFAFVSMAVEQPGAAVFLMIPISLGIVVLGLLWQFISTSNRKRRAASVLSYIEQAVRLNLPLPRIVHAIADGERGRFARDLRRAEERLLQGDSLVSVLDVIPQMPTRVLGLVAAAERHGRLPQVLGRLMDQRRAAISRSLGSLTFYRTYPLIVAIALLSVTGMLMVFVMPKFEAIFKDFGVQLPFITRITLVIARNAGPWVLLLLILLLVAMLVHAVLARGRGAGYGMVETLGGRVANYLPWIGAARMDRALGDLLEFTGDAVESGRAIEPSLIEAAHICENARLRQRVERWALALSAGQALGPSARAAGMSRLISGMLTTADNTADLAQVMRFLGRYYSTRFSRAMALLEAAANPVMAIVLGFFVGWLALSVFAALISLIQTVSSPGPRGL